jgi:hypothetical protein
MGVIDMGNLTKRNAGAYDTHSTNININVGNIKGTKPVLDLSNDTLSMDSGINNDISKGNSIGDNVQVKRDNLNYGGMIDKRVNGLVIRKGRGWVNRCK